MKRLPLVEGSKKIAARKSQAVSQLATAWALRRPEVKVAMVGARSPMQIEETASAAEWLLSDEDLAVIEDGLQRRQASTARV